VQEPDEAGYDGMPRNAIMTGAVDLVLPIAEIPAALVKYDQRMALSGKQNNSRPQDVPEDWLAEIVNLLRTKTAHDFRLYKPGTLRRRIERRMAMVAIKSDETDRYREMLGSDPGELELLAKDLLINVTSFFRDPKVFDFLAEKIIPDWSAATRPITRCASGLPGAAPARRPIRLPCCSTSRSGRRSATSNCRSSPPTLTRMR
jgi:two-component system CheB/CheR fusion protein